MNGVAACEAAASFGREQLFVDQPFAQFDAVGVVDIQHRYGGAA
jgi:hypothetical protein